METKKRKLSKQQQAFLKVFFSGDSELVNVLEKLEISLERFIQWLGQENFVNSLERLKEASYRESAAMLAHYAPAAAKKLMALTESDKSETARKACLDIISMGIFDNNKIVKQPTEVSSEDKKVIDDQTARRLLEILAKEINS